MPDDRLRSVRGVKSVKPPPRTSRNGEILLIVVLFLFVVGITFEIYGHYAYVHTTGASVTRIDRFTGDSCVMPCSTESQRISAAAANTEATPSDDARTCHSASVVRVSNHMKIPKDRKPYPYHQGGLDPSTVVIEKWKRHVVPYASELTDGHIYIFGPSSFVAVSTWSTGDAVQVCATYSRIEKRTFYSVREAEEAGPADIAI